MASDVEFSSMTLSNCLEFLEHVISITVDHLLSTGNEN